MFTSTASADLNFLMESFNNVNSITVHTIVTRLVFVTGGTPARFIMLIHVSGGRIS